MAQIICHVLGALDELVYCFSIPSNQSKVLGTFKDNGQDCQFSYINHDLLIEMFEERFCLIGLH